MLAPTVAAPPDALHDLAPSGRLRAAINFGNPVLAQRDSATGAPRGASVALAEELGRQLGVPVDLVTFPEAGQVAEAAPANQWDIAFLAIEPARAASIGFTAAYVLIEGVYMVPAGSALHGNADIDHAGIRIAVAKGSAYDLFLTRTLHQADVIRATNTQAAIEMLLHGDVDVLAGVRQPMAKLALAHPDMRLLPGRFMEIGQAMGVPAGHEAGLGYLRGFIEAMKASGFVGRALAESGQADATVAPAAAVP